jgi:hypothetical protein
LHVGSTFLRIAGCADLNKKRHFNEYVDAKRSWRYSVSHPTPTGSTLRQDGCNQQLVVGKTSAWVFSFDDSSLATKTETGVALPVKKEHVGSVVRYVLSKWSSRAEPTGLESVNQDLTFNLTSSNVNFFSQLINEVELERPESVAESLSVSSFDTAFSCNTPPVQVDRFMASCFSNITRSDSGNDKTQALVKQNPKVEEMFLKKFRRNGEGGSSSRSSSATGRIAPRRTGGAGVSGHQPSRRNEALISHAEDAVKKRMAEHLERKSMRRLRSTRSESGVRNKIDAKENVVQSEVS